jgi:hypothetical protein
LLEQRLNLAPVNEYRNRLGFTNRHRCTRLERFQEKWQRFSGSEARQNKDLDHFSGSTEP